MARADREHPGALSDRITDTTLNRSTLNRLTLNRALAWRIPTECSSTCEKRAPTLRPGSFRDCRLTSSPPTSLFSQRPVCTPLSGPSSGKCSTLPFTPKKNNLQLFAMLFFPASHVKSVTVQTVLNCLPGTMHPLWPLYAIRQVVSVPVTHLVLRDSPCMHHDACDAYLLQTGIHSRTACMSIYYCERIELEVYKAERLPRVRGMLDSMISAQ